MFATFAASEVVRCENCGAGLLGFVSFVIAGVALVIALVALRMQRAEHREVMARPELERWLDENAERVLENAA